jgi:membrane-associated phospholipid phosphatase
MDLTPVQSADAALAAIDRVLFLGVDPVAALQAIITPALSEYLAICYSFYALLFPLCFGAVLFRAGRTPFRETGFAIGLGLLIAYVSYTLVPAKGPLFTGQFTVPLDLYYSASVKAALMDLSRITWDCFPSMHTTLSVVMLLQLRRYASTLFRVVLPLAAPIPFACVYLRYHYVIDVLVGLAFAGALLWVARRVFAPREGVGTQAM